MAIGTNIPAIVIQKLVPLLIKQLEGLSNASAIIEKLIASIPPNTACNDGIIQNIKSNLEKIQKLIDNIRKILNALQKIRKTLNITAGVAKTIEIAQLLIPLPPFAPPGIIAKTLKIVIDLGNNCKSAAKCLSGLLASAELGIAMASDAIANASILLSNICNQENTTVTRSTALIIANNINQNVNGNVNIGTGVGGVGNSNINVGDDLDLAGVNNSNQQGTASSIFYNKFNVSQDDLNQYQEDVESLLSESRNILTDLIEAPSQVYVQNNPPSNSFGNTGDYFIDAQNQMVYGPKPTDILWNPGVKY